MSQAGRSTARSDPSEGFLVESLTVTKLWGWRNCEIEFNKDVNFLIGRNGSGKTTLLHLLHHSLTGDVQRLARMSFDTVKIRLRSFDNKKSKTVSVQLSDDFLEFKISTTKFQFPLQYLVSERRFSPRRTEEQRRELLNEVQSLVPTVWLPVNRRIDRTDNDDDVRRKRGRDSETVDERLALLLGRLETYRLSLEARMSRRYKQFEREVLTLLLYDEDVDSFSTGGAIETSLTKNDTQQLTRAFHDAGLLNDKMKKAITRHFERTSKAVEHIQKADSDDDIHYEINEVLLIPLIKRTKSIIEYARSLEEDRDSLFESLATYRSVMMFAYT